MRLRAWSGAIVMLVACALLFTACGGGHNSSAGAGTSGSPNAQSRPAITITNFMFSPMALRVSPGATITVTNEDSATHTLTATGGEFNSGVIAQNQTKSFEAPKAPGTYHYICNIHQYMTGTITVT